MDTSLTIPELYLLFGLDGEKGEIKPYLISRISYINLCNIFVELKVRRLVAISTNNKVEVLTHEQTGIAYLDEVLKVIRSSERLRNLQMWIMYFSKGINEREKRIKEVMESLQLKENIKIVKKKRYMLFWKEYYNVTTHGMHNIESFKNELLMKEECSIDLISAYLMLRFQSIINDFFSKEEQEFMENKIDQLSVMQPQVLEISSFIYEIKDIFNNFLVLDHRRHMHI